MENDFKTPDIALMIALVYAGEKVIDVEPLGDGKSILVFENTKTLQQVCELFWQKQLKMPVQDVVGMMRKVKAILRDKRA